MAIRTYISIITLNINGLNAPCKTRNLKLIFKKDVKEETKFNSQSTLY